MPTEGVFFFQEFSPDKQAESCFYYLLPRYNQLFIEDDSFQPRKSNVFFSQGNRTNREAKNVELLGGWKKLLVLLFPLCICINVLTYMHSKHSCRELWPHWEWKPVHCYKAGLKQGSEKTVQDLKWKHRMDGSRIAVGFMPYYTGALISSQSSFPGRGMNEWNECSMWGRSCALLRFGAEA